MVYNLVPRAVNLSGFRSSWKDLVEKWYDKHVLFFHVPKCGGTSISHPLRMKYFLSAQKIDEDFSTRTCVGQSQDEWMRFKQQLFIYFAESGCHYVQGHVPFSQEKFAKFMEKYIFLTILREPRQRIISHYYFDTRTNCMNFSDFLKSDRGKLECSVYSRFFGSLPFSAKGTTEEHVANAIEALESFDVVGILEHPENLQKQIREAMGISLKMPKRNVGETRKKSRSEISDEDLEKLDEMCAGDRAIYAHFHAQHIGKMSLS